MEFFAQWHCQLSLDTSVVEELAVNGLVRFLRRKLGHIVYVEQPLATHQACKPGTWTKAIPPLLKRRCPSIATDQKARRRM